MRSFTLPNSYKALYMAVHYQKQFTDVYLCHILLLPVNIF